MRRGCEALPMWGRLVAYAAVGYRRSLDEADRWPIANRPQVVNLSAWFRGPPKAMKTRGVRAGSTMLGRAGRGASRGPGGPPRGPPYFGRFSTVLHKIVAVREEAKYQGPEIPGASKEPAESEL
jgi:hypothetical protein